MTSLLPWFGTLILLALAFWLGAGLLRRWTGVEATLPETFAAGSLALHSWLLLLDVVGVRWTTLNILFPAVIAFLLTRHRQTQIRSANRGALEPWHWSDWVAVLGLGTFLLAAVSAKATASDFIFHWGFKARRFAEVGGVDWELLQRPSGIHADYPLLLPNLTAASAILGKAWSEPPLMLWSVVALGLLLLEIRRALMELDGRSSVRAFGLLFATFALVAFSLSQRQAGGADIQFALCLFALARSFAELTARASTSSQTSVGCWRIGLWAALAVVTKIEGGPMALFAVAATYFWMVFHQGASSGRPSSRWRLRSLGTGMLRAWSAWFPPFVFGGWWLVRVWHYDLYQDSNFGLPTVERVRLTLETFPRALSRPEWTGFAWLILGLPVLSVLRKTRTFCLLAVLQFGLYLATYFGGEQDTAFWVNSSLPRLVFHVMAVILVATVVQLTRDRSGNGFRDGK